MQCIFAAAALGAALFALPAQAEDPLAGLAPLGPEELAAASGRAGLDTDQANQALLRDNRVGDNSVTGNNIVVGSLNGNAGITTVFQNSGNNTVLQSATTVSITMR